MGKKYVPVLLHINEEGVVKPKQVKAGYDGEWFKIIKTTGSPRRMASLQAGGVGIRYSCVVDIYGEQREVYLFDEGGYKWFIEVEE